MAAQREDIERWFDAGKAKGATHMLIVCDTFDYADYPVYVDANTETPREAAKRYDGKNMQRIMECYALALDKASQMAERRAFHWD